MGDKMDRTFEMLKTALLGQEVQTNVGFIRKLANECAQEINLHPERDPSNIVADKALRAGFNSKQADRLTEETNKELIRPILSSENKAAQNIKADKVKVKSIIDGTDNRPPSEHTTTGPGSLVDKRLSSGSAIPTDMIAPQGSSLSKTAGMVKVARMMTSDMSDYYDEPQTMQNHPFFENPIVDELEKMAHEAHAKPSEREISRYESYVDQGLEEMQAKLARLQREHMSLSYDFVKIAESVINSGGKWEDIIHGTIQVKPDKESCELLKSAAQHLGRRLMIDNPKDWMDALDVFKEGLNPGMEKSSGISVPVNESLISKSLRGRVRVINGDHQMVKKLRDIKCNEKEQRTSIVSIKRLHDFGPSTGLMIRNSNI